MSGNSKGEEFMYLSEVKSYLWMAERGKNCFNLCPLPLRAQRSEAAQFHGYLLDLTGVNYLTRRLPRPILSACFWRA